MFNHLRRPPRISFRITQSITQDLDLEFEYVRLKYENSQVSSAKKPSTNMPGTRCKVLTEMNVKIMVFCSVTLPSLIGTNVSKEYALSILEVEQ